MLGVKVQYLDNWKLKNCVVWFKAFPQTHSAENLRKKMKDLIVGSLGLQPEQVQTLLRDVTRV